MERVRTKQPPMMRSNLDMSPQKSRVVMETVRCTVTVPGWVSLMPIMKPSVYPLGCVLNFRKGVLRIMQPLLIE